MLKLRCYVEQRHAGHAERCHAELVSASVKIMLSALQFKLYCTHTMHVSLQVPSLILKALHLKEMYY